MGAVAVFAVHFLEQYFGSVHIYTDTRTLTAIVDCYCCGISNAWRHVINQLYLDTLNCHAYA
jgi:hypothetical protein